MKNVASKKKGSRDLAASRIVSTTGVCGGHPRVAGTRIPVAVLLRCRALGFSDKRILESYPSLSPADLKAVWSFADNGHKRA